MDEARDDLFVGTFINLKASVSPFAGTVKTHRKKVSYFGIAIGSENLSLANLLLHRSP